MDIDPNSFVKDLYCDFCECEIPNTTYGRAWDSYQEEFGEIQICSPVENLLIAFMIFAVQSYKQKLEDEN